LPQKNPEKSPAAMDRAGAKRAVFFGKTRSFWGQERLFFSRELSRQKMGQNAKNRRKGAGLVVFGVKKARGAPV
jgi:hypothetical protein